MTKFWGFGIGLGLLAAISSPLMAQAETFEMAELTCAELLELDGETGSLVIIWLDGYLAGVSGDTEMNTDYLVGLTEVLVLECAEDPEALVLDMAEAVGLE